MTKTIVLDENEYIREHNPYLYEDEDQRTSIEVDDPYGGKINLYIVQLEYVPHAVREHYAALAAKTGSVFAQQRATQQYQWAGREIELTPKQARKLAKALKGYAKQAESQQ